MGKRLVFAAASLLLPLAACALHRAQPAPVDTRSAPSTEVPLNLVAAQVVRTLDAFNAEAASHALPKLSRVAFDFNTTGAQGAGFSFNLLLFHIGANRDTSNTNEVTFTYAVPSAAPPTAGFNPRAQSTTHDFSQTLLSTLEAAATQVKQTQSIGAAQFSNLTVTLSYGVVWTTSAGGAGAISLVTLDGSVDRRRSDVQTLTLTFGQ